MRAEHQRRRRYRRSGGASARAAARPAADRTLWIALGALLLLALMIATRPPLASRIANGPAAALTMAQARAINAATPFVAERVAPATPYVFRGTSAAREQAVRCLATAALYEAGQDGRGQRAVMQVILNRVRAPAFPRTVCGVVYQGAWRATGCQFSFACDGSAARRPERAGWIAARRRAQAALAGAVFAGVGTATHYHADWVVPYWSGSLDKVAQVRSHIFYRRHEGARVAAGA